MRVYMRVCLAIVLILITPSKAAFVVDGISDELVGVSNMFESVGDYIGDEEFLMESNHARRLSTPTLAFSPDAINKKQAICKQKVSGSCVSANLGTKRPCLDIYRCRNRG
ncbi:hypothetical protein M5689_007436 [Euphorbia peplus]|nr:hypothetical protein M5689_007436 [Euphorbia peplus]